MRSLELISLLNGSLTGLFVGVLVHVAVFGNSGFCSTVTCVPTPVVSVVLIRSFRFILYLPPDSTMYDLVSVANLVTKLGVRILLSGFRIRTVSPVLNGCRSFACWLQYCCCLSSLCLRPFLMLSVGYCGSSSVDVVGRQVLVGRPLSICAGERSISSMDVF